MQRLTAQPLAAESASARGTAPAFSAVVLAGGRSRRMGRDKARISRGGLPLIVRQLRLLRELAPEEVFISARTEADYADLGTRVLADRFAGQGPVAGVERALCLARGSLVLVLAVDLPEMTVALLEQVLRACRGSTGVVPTVAGELEPLAACYPKAAHPIAVERLDAGQNSARDFALACLRCGLVRTLEMPPEARVWFANWNRPADVDGGGQGSRGGRGTAGGPRD
ncbi:MAG: molybdenum cofactor guanylyltransferase [Verrucomicrobiales bacterium]|nr:molybdenum cofactor guanylyltransferase [Verrucomicrobiales bacterium]